VAMGGYRPRYAAASIGRHPRPLGDAPAGASRRAILAPFDKAWPRVRGVG